ncbi:protein of unknown function [Bradyrhizobium vignae]|uniref:Uncharacterized protein n=1 Tax=Bradyrhizobium vignae TaxID=1549949 RepID=A0A2U3Q899_9BRAD|nr:protein of unknown function [Bradyrhizobium vignae]
MQGKPGGRACARRRNAPGSAVKTRHFGTEPSKLDQGKISKAIRESGRPEQGLSGAVARAPDGNALRQFRPERMSDTMRDYATVNGVSARGGSLDGPAPEPGPLIAGGILYVSGLHQLWYGARQRVARLLRGWTTGGGVFAQPGWNSRENSAMRRKQPSSLAEPRSKTCMRDIAVGLALSASAALLLRGRLKLHDLVLVAGIRRLILFHD